jgi:hypothetical protein
LSRGAVCEQRESEIQHVTSCSHSPCYSDTSLHLKTRNISAPLWWRFTFPTITVLTVKLRPWSNGWRQHVPSKRRYPLTILYGVTI